MLRKLVWVLVTVGVGPLVLCGPVGAEEEVGAAPAADSTTAVESEEDAALRRQREKARADLNGTTWKLELTPRIGTVGMREQDTLTFEGDQVTSKTFSREGYTSISFSMDVKNGVPIWQTVQVAEGRGTISWRGEIYGDAMGGIMTERSVEGEAVNYHLKGHLVKRFTPVKREPVPVAVEAVPAVSETPQLVEETEDITPQLPEDSPAPKKNRGLFW